MDTFQALKRQTLMENLETARAEKVRAQLSLMPHVIYGPALSFDGLEWVATFGYDPEGKPLLVGRGDSPNSALMDFNEKWMGSNDSA